MSAVRDMFLGLARRIISAESPGAFIFRPAGSRCFSCVSGNRDFYVHIPYCRGKCEWCPYNTRLLAAEELQAFFSALTSDR